MSLESNPKKEQVIRKGKELFWKFGIKRVTIEEICREAGVSKMTFYKYFLNKTALAVTIFEGLINEYYGYYDQMVHDDIPFEEKLKQLVMLKLEATENMSMEFVRDIYSSDIPELREMIDQMQKKSMTLTISFIEMGKKEGHIRNNLKNEFILLQLNQIVEMMRSDELLSMFDNSKTLTKSILDYFFYGIVTRGRETK